MLGAECYGDGWAEKCFSMIQAVSKKKESVPGRITHEQIQRLIVGIEAKIKEGK